MEVKMNFEQLQYIVYVANEMSITRAAEKLHVSSSAISQSISKLEMELNITIFNRSKTGTIPTQEGNIVVSTAINILNNIKVLKEDLIVVKNSSDSHLKIAYEPTFFHITEKAIKNISIESMDITFDAEEQNPNKLLKNLNKTKFDLAFVSASKEELENENIDKLEHLYKGYACIIVGKNSPLFSYSHVSFLDLLQQRVISYKNANCNFNELIKINKNEVIISTNKIPLLIEMIKEGQAFSYCYDITLKNYPDVINGDIKIIPIKDPHFIYQDFWVIYSTNKEVSKLAKDFIKHVKFQLRKRGDGYHACLHITKDMA